MAPSPAPFVVATTATTTCEIWNGCRSSLRTGIASGPALPWKPAPVRGILAVISYVCALHNKELGGGLKAQLFYTNATEAEKFAAHHDGAGVGVYDCIAQLRPGARRRLKEDVAGLGRLIVDLDLKNVVESQDGALAVLRALAMPPTEIRHSGNGLH